MHSFEEAQELNLTDEELAEHLEKEIIWGPPRVKIIMRPPTPENAGYIGAFSDFPPKKGEDWRRGSDLPDGPYTKDTLESVVKALREHYDYILTRDACTSV